MMEPSPPPAGGIWEGALRAFDAATGHSWYVEAMQSLFYSHGRGRFRRAQALEAAGRLDDSARWYGSFAEESEFDMVYLAAGRIGRGRVFEALERPEDALGAYRQALELLPTPEGPWRDMALEAEAGIERAGG